MIENEHLQNKDLKKLMVKRIKKMKQSSNIICPLCLSNDITRMKYNFPTCWEKCNNCGTKFKIK